MSNALLNAVWPLCMPMPRKFVLIALADFANDSGLCFPSVPLLAARCCAGERTVQEHLAALERDGFLSRQFSKGRSTVYQITDPRSWRTGAPGAPPQEAHHTPAPTAPVTPAPAAPAPAPAAPPPPQEAHHTPAPAAPITTIEPSVEPSGNQQLFAVPANFDDFWREYPTKTAKPQCLAKWLSKGCAAIADRIVDDVKAKKAGDRRWLDGFVPNPLTYLNQERWNDPIQPRQQSPPAKPSVSDSFAGKTYEGTPDHELPAFLRPTRAA